MNNPDEFLENVSKETLSFILGSSFGIYLNANDFFQVACASAVLLDPLDLKWVAQIVEKYPEDGLNAVMAFIEKTTPLDRYITDNYKLAYKELEELNPEIYS